MEIGLFCGPVIVIKTTRLAILVHSDVVTFKDGKSEVWIPKSQRRGSAFVLTRKGDTCDDLEINAGWAAMNGVWPSKKEE